MTIMAVLRAIHAATDTEWLARIDACVAVQAGDAEERGAPALPDAHIHRRRVGGVDQQAHASGRSSNSFRLTEAGRIRHMQSENCVSSVRPSSARHRTSEELDLAFDIISTQRPVRTSSGRGSNATASCR